MAEERPGSWFGFGFCGFGQALGSGRGRQVLSPEPLRVPDAGTDICDIGSVSAAWSYTAIVSRERPFPFPACPLQAPPTSTPAPPPLCVPASCPTRPLQDPAP